MYVDSPEILCSVIDFEMVLTAYCKQRIVQLYFERRVLYGNNARVLAACLHCSYSLLSCFFLLFGGASGLILIETAFQM